MEISTREIPVQPWGEDFDSGFVLFPVLDHPGRYVAQFSDGSYTSAWVPKGAELDELTPADTPPLPAASAAANFWTRLFGRLSIEQVFVLGAVVACAAAMGDTLADVLS